MKIKLFFAASLLVSIMFSLGGCTNACVAGFCFGSGLHIKERNYDLDNKNYHIAGDLNGEFTSYDFKMGEEESIEELSFGMYDAANLREYSAIKKIHILSDSALATYREKYLIPQIGCPVSFMNQHLESLLLLPVNDEVAAKLEKYDIPFDGRGTPFKLKGHYLTHDHSYFISHGETSTLTIVDHEDVMSNFGSAQHPIHYFLVTDIES